MPTPILYNPDTKVTATPTATTTTAQQQAAAQQGFIPQPTPPITYSADSLNPAKALSVPTKAVNPNDTTSATGMITEIGANNAAIFKGMEADQEKQVEAAKTAKSDSSGDLATVMKDYITTQQSRGALEAEAGIPKLTRQVTDVTNLIDARSQAITKQIEEIDNNFQGTVEGKNAAVSIARRDGAREMADLAIVQSALNRNLTTATNLIDRKINLTLEPLKTKLDFTKMFYEENKQELTKEEDRAFQLKIKEAETIYSEKKISEKSLEDEKLKYLGYAVNAKSNVDAMQAIQSAKTAQEVPLIAAKYGITSSAGSGSFTPTQVADGSVRAGVDQATFNSYSPDVKAFFTQTNDTNIQPVKDALTDVATGKQKAADFNKTVDGMSLAPSVKKFLKEQAAEAEKKAPPPQPSFFSRVWNAIF